MNERCSNEGNQLQRVICSQTSAKLNRVAQNNPASRWIYCVISQWEKWTSSTFKHTWFQQWWTIKDGIISWNGLPSLQQKMISWQSHKLSCHEFMDEAGKSVALVMEKINVCRLINNKKVAKTCLGSKKQSKRASLFCLNAQTRN